MRTPSPVRGVRPPAEHWVDRPEMEAPQGVELTGTNRPSDLNTPTPTGLGEKSTALAFTMRFPEHDREQEDPPCPTCSVERFGGHSGGETPGPIPNPEVKPSSADGTAPETVWESRTPPNTNIYREEEKNPPKGRGTSPLPFFHAQQQLPRGGHRAEGTRRADLLADRARPDHLHGRRQGAVRHAGIHGRI